MARIISTIVFLLMIHFCSGQIVREYLFGDRFPINDSSSLVLMIKDPQTEFAKELNHRIYSDTNFLKRIKKEWFYEYDPEKGKLQHFCDYDLFFYKLEGTTMTYLTKLNSHCGISEINCSDLTDLANNGKPLHVDTLSSIPANAQKEDLFNSHFVSSSYLNSIEWSICKTSRYPKLFYDGYVKTTIKLDTLFSISKNIQNFIFHYKENGGNFNWNAWYDNTDNSFKFQRFEKFKESFDLEVYIYLFKEDFEKFRDFEIYPIAFEIPENNKLILIYND